VKFNAVLEGVAEAGGDGLRLPAGAALRGGVVPVNAAICAAEKARMTARARSVAALFIITFRLARAGMSGYGVSNIAHYCDIDIGNMQLKMKEILLWAGCRIGGNIIYRDCII
jgi:hypothetical protein